MSKSNPNGCLFLDDTPEDISRKIKKAVTDEEGIKNLHFLYNCFVSPLIPNLNVKLKEDLINALSKELKK